MRIVIAILIVGGETSLTKRSRRKNVKLLIRLPRSEEKMLMH